MQGFVIFTKLQRQCSQCRLALISGHGHNARQRALAFLNFAFGSTTLCSLFALLALLSLGALLFFALSPLGLLLIAFVFVLDGLLFAFILLTLLDHRLDQPLEISRRNLMLLGVVFKIQLPFKRRLICAPFDQIAQLARTVGH